MRWPHRAKRRAEQRRQTAASAEAAQSDRRAAARAVFRNVQTEVRPAVTWRCVGWGGGRASDGLRETSGVMKALSDQATVAAWLYKPTNLF